MALAGQPAQSTPTLCIALRCSGKKLMGHRAPGTMGSMRTFSMPASMGGRWCRDGASSRGCNAADTQLDQPLPPKAAARPGRVHTPHQPGGGDDTTGEDLIPADLQRILSCSLGIGRLLQEELSRERGVEMCRARRGPCQDGAIDPHGLKEAWEMGFRALPRGASTNRGGVHIRFTSRTGPPISESCKPAHGGGRGSLLAGLLAV